MEPDFDKLVSNKIRHSEQRLIPWNKQAVWQKVESETNAPRRSYYFYYSVAALILLLIYFGVQRIPKEVKPQVNDPKIISAQEAKEPQKKSIIPEESLKQLPEYTAQTLEDSATVQVSVISNSFRETPPLVQQETRHADAVIEPVATDIAILEKEFPVPVEVTVHEEKIRPIVGVITESYSEGTANVKQKKPLHKLKSPEPVPWENVPNALVFARKK